MFGWGFLLGWRIKKFITMLLNLQSAMADNLVALLLPKNHVVRLTFSSDRPLALDDVDTIQDLVSKADREFTHSWERIRNLLAEGPLDR